MNRKAHHDITRKLKIINYAKKTGNVQGIALSGAVRLPEKIRETSGRPVD